VQMFGFRLNERSGNRQKSWLCNRTRGKVQASIDAYVFILGEESPMSSTNMPKNQKDVSLTLTPKLMVHGFVCPESSCALSIEVRRGMPIISEDSNEVGKVAAVILDEETQKATHLLLGRLPEIKGYWLVPIDLISEVRDGAVRLGIRGDAIGGLPIWRSGD